MNQPLDQISGRILIRGRSYSAKEVIRGLLEQGIAINEKTEGLRIGFKLISPESSSITPSMDIGQGISCPFIPIMSQISDKLDHLTGRVDFAEERASTPEQSFFDPPADDSSAAAFSPFSSSPFTTKNENEKEPVFSSTPSYMDNKRKCSSCGSTLPGNAFFCNKCGNHVRSG
ncbi:hypothetical protein CEE45_01090 [Candidatus Heimdallarchaeota archaeon B3_Heim]|nr:MAG: hypothetical protein CEE45_01090 [Candidatus Heimdallarchaeota archaeon B3_Heim]